MKHKLLLLGVWGGGGNPPEALPDIVAVFNVLLPPTSTPAFVHV